MAGQQQPEGSFHDSLASLKRFYRSTLYQAIILGLVSFTQPGIWDALNSTYLQQKLVNFNIHS